MTGRDFLHIYRVAAAATRVNRRPVYALCDMYGIPSIFFTIIPDDECSFRVRMRVNAGQYLDMPKLDCADDNYIADFNLRKAAPIKYPGACALEYERIIHIVLKTLLNWDSHTQKGSKVIFETLLAYALAHEKQD